MKMINNEKGLVFADKTEVGIDKFFTVEGCQMKIAGNTPYEAWTEKLHQLRRLNGALCWFLGDMIVYAETEYGERCYDVFDEFDYDIESLKKAAWVSQKFDGVRRRTELTWSHHVEVASLSDSKADKWLDIAEREKWSTRDLRRAIKETEGKTSVSDVPSVRLLSAFTGLKEEVEDILKSMPVAKWDKELLEKMRETFYGVVLDIEGATGWTRDNQKPVMEKERPKKKESLKI